MPTDYQTSESISSDRIKDVFKSHLYSEPTSISAQMTQKLVVTIKNEQSITITKDASKVSKDFTFQGQTEFFLFMVETENRTFSIIGSQFSLYDYISREPYLETKAEYEFQQQLKAAFGLADGFTYHMPGHSEDFVKMNVTLDEVVNNDLVLRYEHDDLFFYLFVMMEKKRGVQTPPPLNI